MPPIPTHRSALGIAKEVTPGTAVAPTDFIPYTSIEPNDERTQLADTGVRGSMVDEYGSVVGPMWSTYGFGGNVHPDTIGYVLASQLGDVATTGASAPYTHTFAVKNSGDGQPASYTLTDHDGTNARAFPGCKFSSAEFSFNAEDLLTYSASAVGYASATATAPTTSYTAIDPMAAWKLTATVAGASVPIEGGSLTIARPVTPIHTNDGTQNPYALFAGPVSVEGSITVVYEDETELTRYRDGTKPALILDLSTGSGSTLVQVKFVLSKTSYRSGRKVRSKDWVEAEFDIKGEANTTDVGASGGYSPIKATLKNARASGAYA